MKNFKNILALDSALQGVSVGVCAGGKCFARSELMAVGQAERLMPMIEDIVGAAGLKFSDIDAIVTSVGPGAFTGLRIGLSAAKSLGLALEIPVFGVTTLQALASQYVRQKNPDRSIAVILETKREDFYFQTFSKDTKATSDAAALPAAQILNKIRGMVILGDAVRFTGVSFEPGTAMIDAGVMALEIYEKQGGGAALPVYLRGADITTPKKPGRPALQSH